jgi:hypothetical protein
MLIYCYIPTATVIVVFIKVNVHNDYSTGYQLFLPFIRIPFQKKIQNRVNLIHKRPDQEKGFSATINIHFFRTI